MPIRPSSPQEKRPRRPELEPVIRPTRKRPKGPHRTGPPGKPPNRPARDQDRVTYPL